MEFFNVLSVKIFEDFVFVSGKAGGPRLLGRKAAFCRSSCQRSQLVEQVITFGHKMAAFSRPTLRAGQDQPE